MKKIIRLNNLDCANCANKMQQAIAKLQGVTSVNVSFLTQRITLELDESKENEIMQQVKSIVGKIEPDCTLI